MRATAQALIEQAEAALAAEDSESALSLLQEAEDGGAERDRCSGNRWLAYVLQGDLLAAWRESDAIRLRGAPDPHRFWNGEDLHGRRVVLRCLHGFGDAVQMFRFLPRLRSMASHLIVEVPPRLVELAACFNGMGEVITWGEQAPAHPLAWDVQIEVMELPYLLRVSTDDLAPEHGYLRLPPETIDAAARLLRPHNSPRVGVVWAAGDWNRARSLPVDLLDSLTRVAGDAEFWSLQGGGARYACRALPGAPWRDVYECGDGIVPLASVVQGMDLVITVDTLVAHLAGAFGVPCWLLLQHRADWRWMSGRSDTPWYPSLQLMRQPASGDWAGLLAQVARELSAWVRDFE